MHNCHISRLLPLALVALLAACGSDDGTPSEDTSIDVSDAGGDSGGEDTSTDTGEDVPDGGADTGADADDTGTDAADTGDDATDVGGDTPGDATDTGDDAGDVTDDTGDVTDDTGDAGDAEGCDALPAEARCSESDTASCLDADILRTCVTDEEGCMVWREAACGEGLACDAGLCADICEIRGECSAEAYCDANFAVACSLDGDECLVESGRTECEFGCLDGACLDDPCEDAPCSEEDADYCDGDSYFTCVYEEVADCYHWQEDDCSATLGETCLDDGFTIGCFENPCGDGFADGFVGEECDDGNYESGDGCSDTCEIEDGAICIFGEDGISICQIPVCGDGTIQFGESCDAAVALDGCSGSCQPNDGWVCEGSPSSCERLTCGDSTVSRSEGCDDGGTESGDGCSSTCATELSDVAGDTTTFEGEIAVGDPYFVRVDASCENESERAFVYDAFRVTNPGLETLTVQIEARYAGDGYLQLFSAADFDPADPAAACVAANDDHPTFGADGSFIRDAHLAAGTDYFVVVTSYAAYEAIGTYTVDVITSGCGDGVVVEGEECDDRNTADGDGCSSSCVVEEDFTCLDEPSYCHTPGCGGGLVEEGEECDDGNDVGGDGCSATCEVEGGAVCLGERPSECRIAECGDGFVDAELNDEECDDGNGVGGDGCSASCLVEADHFCSGEPSECVAVVCGDGTVGPGESCDDGNSADGDGCSASCLVELPSRSAEPITITGSLDDTDPVFGRANEACEEGGDLVYYDAIEVVNSTGSAVSLRVTASWSGDGYLHLYSSFDPSNPTDGCVDGNDDFEEDEAASFVLDLTVLAGDTRTIVVSSWSSFDATGEYSLVIDTDRSGT